ncbi:ssDNA endodeoxyribonuclease [Gryganskiella cystojenkinii]|nr:ssDNA endodeoxyribonuclease [Gryganskiella cystojenkinii]
MPRYDDEQPKCNFEARLKNVRFLAILIKSVNFKDTATCKISSTGLSFAIEESRCVFAKCLILATIFEDFKYESPMAQQADDQENNSLPNGDASMQNYYDEDGGVMFEVNLSILLSCLNTFGTANAPSTSSDAIGHGAGAHGHGYGHGHSHGHGAINATAIRLSYKGPGSTLDLTLEDAGIVTTCRIPTVEPELPVVFDFNEESHSKIVLQSEWLEEGLRDLDATSDRVVMRLSPDIPHLRISSLGTIENLDVNYSMGDVLETFYFPYDRPLEASYNFVHVLHVLRACQTAHKATILIDNNSFMKMQFLIPTAPAPDRKWLYTEYAFTPLEG